MNTALRATFRCLFCGGRFEEDRTALWLCLRFCPRCRDLYVLAFEAVRRFAESETVERFSDHAVVIPRNLPRREEAA